MNDTQNGFYKGDAESVYRVMHSLYIHSDVASWKQLHLLIMKEHLIKWSKTFSDYVRQELSTAY